MHPDLFGGETAVFVPKAGFKGIKQAFAYGPKFDHRNCSNCKSSYMVEGNTNNYRKCSKIGESN
jgi:hypothetical protein